MKPAIPSQPPPPGTEAEGRPMTPFLATVWTVGYTLAAGWLLQLTTWLRKTTELDVISAIACQAAAVLACLFFILRVHAPQARIRDVLALRSTHAGFYPLGVSLGLAVTLPASVIYSAILRRWPDASPDGLAKVLSSGSLGQRVVVVAAVVVLAPLMEEALFRGGLFTLQRRGADALTAVVVTAVLFALAHIVPQRFLPIVLLGLCMGVVRAASGSLYPSLLMHATFNALPVYKVLSFGAPADDPSEPLPWALAAGSAAVAALLLLAARQLGNRSEAAARARARDRA